MKSNSFFSCLFHRLCTEPFLAILWHLLVCVLRVWYTRGGQKSTRWYWFSSSSIWVWVSWAWHGMPLPTETAHWPCVGDLTKLSALSISSVDVVNFSSVFKQCAYSEQLCRNAGWVCGGCCVIVWMLSVDAGFGKPKLRSFWVSYISPPCSLICVFVFSSIYIFISENNSFNQLYFLTLYTFYKIYTWVFWYFHVIERAVVYLLFQIPMAFVGKQDRNLAL